MFKVKSNFMGDFKLGDNINHNLEILSLLYTYQANGTGYQIGLLNRLSSAAGPTGLERRKCKGNYRIEQI